MFLNHDPLKLCLITHPDSKLFEDYEKFILSAIKGGVTSVQLRNKTVPTATLKTMAQQLLTLLRPLNIPLLINDHVELAQAIDADGVHLGQSDMHPLEARRCLGADKLIGWSIETWAQLEQANALSCINYVAASAIFPSKNKQNCKTIWGLDGLKKITSHSHHPVLAIGGIDKTRLAEVMQAGARGVVVIGAIHDADHPERAAHELIEILNRERP